MLTKSMLGALVVAAIMLAPPTFAAPPYVIYVGGDDTARAVPFTGVADAVELGPSRVLVECVNSTLTGVVHAGPVAGVDPDPAMTVDSSTWGGCSGPIGLGMTISTGGGWTFNVTDTSVTGPPPADTKVDGYLDHIDLHFSATNDPAGCNFTVTGRADAYFNEVTQQLVVEEDGLDASGHQLTTRVPGGSTCFGLIEDQAPAAFLGIYDISTAGGPIDITDGGSVR